MAWDKAKKLEHYTLCLTRLAGLFSAHCEKRHHGEPYDESRLYSIGVPDLLVYVLKIADLENLNLEAAYLARIREVEARLASRT